MYNERLKYLREELELKQYEIAKILNIAPSTYNNYETEYYLIPIKHLNILSNFFKVSIDYLFEFTTVKRYMNTKQDIDNELSGQRIKQFRKSQKFSQAKMAALLNVDQTLISRYELGKDIIATSFLYEICKKYKISADYLLGKVDRNNLVL